MSNSIHEQYANAIAYRDARDEIIRRQADRITQLKRAAESMRAAAKAVNAAIENLDKAMNGE